MPRHGKILEHAPTYKAIGGPVTGKRYGKFVVGGVAQCDTEGEQADGIFDADAAENESVTFLQGGVQEVEAGAAVAEVALLMTDDEGRAITHTTGNIAVGKVDAGNSAGAAGDILQVHHWPSGPSL